MTSKTAIQQETITNPPVKRLTEGVREYIELKLEINQLYKDLNRAKVEINFNKKEEKNPTIAETDYYYIRSTFQLERAISEIKDKINAKKIRSNDILRNELEEEELKFDENLATEQLLLENQQRERERAILF